MCVTKCVLLSVVFYYVKLFAAHLNITTNITNATHGTAKGINLVLLSSMVCEQQVCTHTLLETYKVGQRGCWCWPTLNELRFVGTPHVLQDAAVEGLCQLCRHGSVEVWLVAFQDTLQRELAHTQHLKVPIHDAFGPGTAVLILEQPQVKDLTNAENCKCIWCFMSVLSLYFTCIFYNITILHFSFYYTQIVFIHFYKS